MEQDSEKPDPETEAPSKGFSFLAWMPMAAFALFAVVGLGGGYLLDNYYGTSTAHGPKVEVDPGIRSLAVLPFKPSSNEEEQRDFADSMTEALTAELAKVSSLQVIDGAFAKQYKNTQKPLRVIAQELKADGLIEGSVDRREDEVRITVKLVRGGTELQLWSKRYTEELAKVDGMQSRVALSAVEEVLAVLASSEK